MDDSHVERMRERARQMRRAASMSANQEIIAILSRAADEADADAAQLEAELRKQVQQLPPQA
jgi:F0F1-type ATP synthase membrane subunit b/b'